MKTLIFIMITFLTTLFGHGFVVHNQIEDGDVNRYHFGGVIDIQYRTEDLYSQGVMGSNGYELHGQKEAVEVEHLALFLAGYYHDNFAYVLELNRHNGSNDTINELTERAYIGYKNSSNEIRLGRSEYALSFVRSQPYGYGFISMPIMLGAYFDETLYGDGLSYQFSYKNSSIMIDTLADMYHHTLRNSLQLKHTMHSYMFDNHSDTTFIGYIQHQEAVQKREEPKSNSTSHTHSSEDGCNNLLANELCFDTSRNLFGVGMEHKNSLFNIQAEYLYTEEKGDVLSVSNKVTQDLALSSLYGQVIVPITLFKQSFDVGTRYEYYWFDGSYKGGGAQTITQQLFTNTQNRYDSLTTFMGSYHFKTKSFGSHTLRAETAFSDSDYRISAQYLFVFDSGF